MRGAAIFVLAVGCQPLVSIDADSAVDFVAVVTLANDGSIESATGMIAIEAGSALPRQPNDGRALLYGFRSDQFEVPDERLSEPLRFAAACDGALVPIWVSERTGDTYRELAPESASPLTAGWTEPKCDADRICVDGRCLDAVVDVDAGRSSACARWASGRVSCWGLNDCGAVGESEAEVYLATEAHAVEAIDDAAELSLGDQQSCVRRRDGRVSCWGLDVQGEQLGMRAPIQGRPRAVSGVAGATALSAGNDHACVVIEGGEVECWGRNSEGELGDGTTIGAGLPVRALGVSGALQVATGANHSCARIDDGRVLCWGQNEGGQLGPGPGDPVEAIGRGAELMDSGSNHTCAIVEGELSCWGDNTFGQLGGGNPQLSGRAVQVDLGPETSCALLDDESVECWGSSRHGELGVLETFPFYLNLPLAAPLPPPILDVAVGTVFVCALDAAHAVWCWGADQFGQLGAGRSGNVFERQVALEDEVTKIGAGDEMSCALLANGSLQCWGHNDYGQLGRGERSVIKGPGAVMLDAPVIDVEAGYAHACAIVQGGDVHCWGDNRYWQVQPNGAAAVATPVRVLGGAIDLALGDYHSCAVLAGGEVACWGLNGAYGTVTPVGHGAFGEVRPVDLVPGVERAVSADAGYDQTCALKEDRTVKCWGRDSDEQELSEVDSIALGRSHTCAVSLGVVYCFGANDHGQLGDGSFANHASPMPVLGLPPARALVMGSSHVCAIVESGELWCWGDNLSAQLNDGDWPNDRANAALVPGLGGVLFGGGFRHSCVYTERGQVECWGWNEWGQVGFDSAAIELLPVRVLGLEPR